MFEGTLLTWKLWRLERARKSVSARYEFLAKHAPTEADEGPIVFARQMKIAEIDDAARQLANDEVLRQAHRYLLLIPPNDQPYESWEESGFTSKWRLTPKAFIELRDAVRAEHKAHHELWQGRVVWIGSATGLIGALTGLISVTLFHTPK